MVGPELVHFDVSALTGLLRKLENRGRDVSKLTPLVAEILVTAVEDEFDTEGHGAWPPLAESTIAARRGGGGGAKMLQDTSVLAGSIRPDFGDDFGAAATDVPYAIFHVSSAPRKKIPERNFLNVLHEETLLEIEDVLVAELVSR